MFSLQSSLEVCKLHNRLSTALLQYEALLIARWHTAIESAQTALGLPLLVQDTNGKIEGLPHIVVNCQKRYKMQLQQNFSQCWVNKPSPLVKTDSSMEYTCSYLLWLLNLPVEMLALHIGDFKLSQLSCLSSSVGRASHLECVRHGFESHLSAAFSSCLGSCVVLCCVVLLCLSFSLSRFLSVWVFMYTV